MTWVYNSVAMLGEALSRNEAMPSPARLSPVELRNRELINDPALAGYSVSGRSAQAAHFAGEAGGPLVEEGAWTYRLDPQGSAELVSYRGSEAVVRVPERIGGAPVASLAAGLFAGHGEIVRIIFPSCVSHMGSRVFDACGKLEEVELPAALEKLPALAFAGCRGLGRVRFNAPVVRIERAMFAETSLRVIELGPDVCDFERGALDVAHLERVEVDSGNAALSTDGFALYSADGVELMRGLVPCKSYRVIPGTKRIGERAFDSQEELACVLLPDSLEDVGALAFAKTGLASLDVPASVKRIGDKAFFGCARLEAVSLSEGLSHLGEGAFALSALSRVALPASLRNMGSGAFSGTPAQDRVGSGGIAISDRNPFLRLDAKGGLYFGDVFAEYLGRESSYVVSEGTRRVAEGACRRNGMLRRVVLPEGVLEIGAEAFRGSRKLVEVHLPDSLESVGDRAFMETSVEHLALSRNVTSLGQSALLVQGEGFVRSGRPIRSLLVDVENPAYYVESGLLCARGKGHDGGDVCLQYVGPDVVVRIPRAVNRIAPYALCGCSGIEELHVHEALHSICRDALFVKAAVPRLFVRLAQDDGEVWETFFPVTSFTPQFRNMTELLSTDERGTTFNFAFYDAWISHAKAFSEFAPAALSRLAHPVRLSERAREVYLGIFSRKASQACRLFAERAELGALELLCDLDVLDGAVVGSELDRATTAGQAQATACLLELRRRRGWGGRLDFGLWG